MSRRNRLRQHALRVSRTPFGQTVIALQRRLGASDRLTFEALSALPDPTTRPEDPLTRLEHDIERQRKKVKNARGKAKAKAQAKLTDLRRERERDLEESRRLSEQARDEWRRGL